MFLLAGAWMSRQLAGAGGRLTEAIVALLLLLALVGGPYWLGARNQAKADALVQAQAQAAAARKLALLQAKGAELAAKLDAQQARTRVVYQTLTKEVPHVVTVYRPAPGAALRDLPVCVFTRGFVGVWNDALAPSGGMPAAAGGAAGAPAAAGTADAALDAGIGEADILGNHIDNAQQCGAIRAQLDALIDWHAAADR